MEVVYSKQWFTQAAHLMAVDKARILKHLQTEVYCRLGISPVHGIGVFAIKDIPKGAKPLVSLIKIKEFSFSKKEINKLPASVKKEVRMFCYYDKDEYLIPSIGLNAMNMAFYMNHSKTPNVKYLKNNDIVALRKIKANEELFFDYDLAFDELHIFE
jgi:SET domain-containing protein